VTVPGFLYSSRGWVKFMTSSHEVLFIYPHGFQFLSLVYDIITPREFIYKKT
jgi:hypothetical protein